MTPPPNPYAPPASAAEGTESTFAVNRDEAEAFVGKQSSYYWRRWRRAMGRRSPFAGFNFAAFFFGTYWLLYRRMYREFWLAVALTVSMELIIRALGEKGNLGYAFLNVGVGLAGNSLYLRRARKVIEAERLVNDPQTLLVRLGQRGGVSFKGVIICAVVTVLAVAIALFAGG